MKPAGKDRLHAEMHAIMRPLQRTVDSGVQSAVELWCSPYFCDRDNGVDDISHTKGQE